MKPVVGGGKKRQPHKIIPEGNYSRRELFQKGRNLKKFLDSLEGENTVVLRYPQRGGVALVPGLPPKCRCSSLFYKMASYLHITYAHPPEYFISRLLIIPNAM